MKVIENYVNMQIIETGLYDIQSPFSNISYKQ